MVKIRWAADQLLSENWKSEIMELRSLVDAEWIVRRSRAACRPLILQASDTSRKPNRSTDCIVNSASDGITI